MDTLTLSIIAPAFMAGVIVLLSHIPLGMEVLKRGIIFIDIAIAQVAGLGIILASFSGFDVHGWELQGVALTSALLGAGALGLIEKRAGRYQEAVIGVVFVLAATGSILLLSGHPQGGEHLQNLLVGQVLWVEWPQLMLPAAVSAIMLALWWRKPVLFSGKGFYYLFAVAITLSVQVVGVYLVFASLILPAFAVIRFAQRQTGLGIALLTGICAYGLGLLLSATFDLPSGAVIVWSLALISGLAYAVSSVSILRQ